MRLLLDNFQTTMYVAMIEPEFDHLSFILKYYHSQAWSDAQSCPELSKGMTQKFGKDKSEQV